MPQQIFFYLMKLPSFAMRFEFPKGIAVDASGYVYVADDAKHRIQKSDTNGNFRKEWGRKGSDKAEFKFPKGVAVDASGFVYVTDDEIIVSKSLTPTATSSVNGGSAIDGVI